MSRIGPCPSPSSPGRAGFSLVELLVSLLVAGLIASAVVRLLLSQNAFYAENDDRTLAGQNLRAAADLLSAELRLAGSSDLLEAEPASVSVRFDVLRAVVCGSSPAAGTVTVFVYDSVDGPNLLPGFRGYGFSDPYSEAWDHRDSAPVAVSLGSGQATCESRGTPAGLPAWRYRTLGDWLLPGAFDSVPDRGAVVTRYGRLTYSLEPSSFDRGLALWRNGQELVAPFQEGAAFSYVMSNGTVQSSVAPASLRDVRAVRMVATALGQGENRYGVDSELRLDVRLQE